MYADLNQIICVSAMRDDGKIENLEMPLEAFVDGLGNVEKVESVMAGIPAGATNIEMQATWLLNGNREFGEWQIDQFGEESPELDLNEAMSNMIDMVAKITARMRREVEVVDGNLDEFDRMLNEACEKYHEKYAEMNGFELMMEDMDGIQMS